MKATILCYHKIGPEADEGRRLNIEPARLDAHIRFYLRRGYRFFRAADLPSSNSNWCLCLTFDDAYESALTFGRAALDRHGQPGTFYAVVALIGQTSVWDGDSARPLAEMDQLISAQAAGHEIGNHTETHPRLSQLDRASQEVEIRSAHETLLKAGIDSRSLCYPYGAFNSETVEIGTELGYRIAVSLRKGVATESSDPMSLPRVVVAFSDTLPMLLYKTAVKPLLQRIGGISSK